MRYTVIKNNGRVALEALRRGQFFTCSEGSFLVVTNTNGRMGFLCLETDCIVPENSLPEFVELLTMVRGMELRTMG